MRFAKVMLIFSLICSTSLFAMNKQQDICEANGINYTQAKSFFVDMQTLLRKDDINKISKYVAFPLRVNERKNNKSTTYYIRNAQAFKEAYPKLFNERMKEILMQSEVFCNYQGAAIGNGNVWFKTSKAGVKIFVINSVEADSKKK